MEQYSFSENLYYVKGHTHSCIYDLNKGRLIHFTKDYANVIDKIIGKEVKLIALGEEERDKLTCLLDNNVISICMGKVNYGDISSLKKRSVVDFAWIEITNKCNLRCIHCYDDACATNQSMMTLKDFQKVVDELVSNNIKKIQLIGGEPLIVPYLKEMILYARPFMELIVVFTNATMLNEEMARFFAINNVQVAVSVYSYDPKYHDYVTKQKGSHVKTNDGIGLLRKFKVKYRVANVLMDGLCLGKKNTDFYTLNPKRDVVRMSGRANINLLNKEYIKLKSITIDRFNRGISLSSVSKSVSGHNCFASKIYIAADMNVYPCVMERRLCHGNLNSKHLKDILDQDILLFNKDKVMVCKDCEFRYACFDCRPDSIEGDIYEKPWYCSYNPQEGKWIDFDEFADNLIRKYNISRVDD